MTIPVTHTTQQSRRDQRFHLFGSDRAAGYVLAELCPEGVGAGNAIGGLSASRLWVLSVLGRGEAGCASLRDMLLRRRSGGVVVFVDQSAEYSALSDLVDGGGFGRRLVDAGRQSLVDAAVGPVAVVVVEVLEE